MAGNQGQLCPLGVRASGGAPFNRGTMNLQMRCIEGSEPSGILVFSTVDLIPVYFQALGKVRHGLKSPSLPSRTPCQTLKLIAAGRSFQLLRPGHSLGLTAWAKSSQSLRSQFLEGFLGHLGVSYYTADCTGR